MPRDLVESFSGVRGIWGQGLNKQLAQKYALAYSRLLFQKLGRKLGLIIGYDTRTSSQEIARIFRAGFSVAAKEIIDVGIMPTQAIELGVREYNLDGGVIISASHNPPEFNGWKLLDSTGAIISPEFLEEIKSYHPDRSDSPNRPPEIQNKHQDLKTRYINFAKEIIGQKGLRAIKSQHFKIVADPNGGAAIVLLKELCQSLGVEGHYLNMKLGKFKRKIEPNFESLGYLRPIIVREKADFAIGIDCDGDRAEIVLGKDCAYVQKHGPVVNGQYLLAIVVDEILSEMKKTQGKIVVTNDCTSALIRKTAQKYGAKVQEVEVGEINVLQAMDKANSPIGGEGSSSGAIFAPSRCRDGLLSLAIILRYLARKNKTLAQALNDFPDFYSFRDKLKCAPKKQIETRKNIKKYLLTQGFKIQERGGKTGTVKALIGSDSFIFFRASKTEPGAFRIITDAPDKEKTKKLLQQGIKIFNMAKG